MSRKAAVKQVVDAEVIDINKQQRGNGLKIRIDELKTFQPLTNNQKLFFEAYKQGDYFIALHGVAGT